MVSFRYTPSLPLMRRTSASRMLGQQGYDEHLGALSVLTLPMDLLNLVHDPEDVLPGVQPTLAQVRPGFVKQAAGLVEVVVGAGHPCFAPEEVATGLRSEDSPVGFFESAVALGVLN